MRAKQRRCLYSLALLFETTKAPTFARCNWLSTCEGKSEEVPVIVSTVVQNSKRSWQTSLFYSVCIVKWRWNHLQKTKEKQERNKDKRHEWWSDITMLLSRELELKCYTLNSAVLHTNHNAWGACIIHLCSFASVTHWTQQFHTPTTMPEVHASLICVHLQVLHIELSSFTHQPQCLRCMHHSFVFICKCYTLNSAVSHTNHSA